MSDKYFVCPGCGFKQRSKANKRIKCHRCGRSYKVSKAKRSEKKPDPEKGKGFFNYEISEEE